MVRQRYPCNEGEFEQIQEDGGEGEAGLLWSMGVAKSRT